MTSTLVYNPQSLCYEVLPTVAERKIAIISDINKIQYILSKEVLSFKQFDAFMNMSIDQLAAIVASNAEVLRRAL